MRVCSGVSLAWMRFFESLPVRKSLLCSIVLIPDSASRLLVGVERNAPSAVLIAEFSEVFRWLRWDLGARPYMGRQKSILETIIDLMIWIRVVVLVLYLVEDRCLIMARGLASSDFSLFIWDFQLYLWFIVRPRIFREFVYGMIVSPEIILALQLCLRHMCRIWHFSRERTEPDCEHHSFMRLNMVVRLDVGFFCLLCWMRRWKSSAYAQNLISFEIDRMLEREL